jgi:hypothetical protein
MLQKYDFFADFLRIIEEIKMHNLVILNFIYIISLDIVKMKAIWIQYDLS